MTLEPSPPPTNTNMDAYEANEILPDGADPPLPIGFHVPVADQQEALEVNHRRLQTAVQSVLEDSPYQHAMVSVAIVDDPTIHKINFEYLQHDYPTDVISFALNSDGNRLEAELIVSSETAIRNAKQYGWSPADELLLYAIHGTLHLVGYLDKTSADQAIMVAAEAAHLQKLGITLPADQSRWQQRQQPSRGETTQ